MPRAPGDADALGNRAQAAAITKVNAIDDGGNRRLEADVMTLADQMAGRATMHDQDAFADASTHAIDGDDGLRTRGG